MVYSASDPLKVKVRLFEVPGVVDSTKGSVNLQHSSAERF